MIFSSYKFIFYFFPIVYIGFLILNTFKLKQVSGFFLVIASFYFYAQGSPYFFPYFMGTVFFNYIIGTLIINAGEKNNQIEKRIFYYIGLAENILLLGYFKYINFFIENINAVAHASIQFKNIILPIGISFFTFQLIAYIVDCYRGETKEYNVLDYLLFITFFPQLIVGPIVHHKDIVPQFASEQQGKFNAENFMFALFTFSIGCAKKILIADPLTTYSQVFFGDISIGTFWQSWGSSVAYTISYYFDLSGYADMAIGLGLFFNVKIPENFNSPYKSRNFKIYWQRWHMTLSKFLGDYIFRSVYKKGFGSINFYASVMLTFLVSGFWHGAGWNFVMWGIINGIFVCTANFMTRKRWQMPYLLAWFLTTLGIVGTRILFVSPSINEALTVYKMMFDFSVFKGFTLMSVIRSAGLYIMYNLYTFVVLVTGILIVYFGENTFEIRNKFKPNLKYALWSGILLIMSLFQMGSVAKFLYFQF